MTIIEQLLKELQQVKHTAPSGTPVGPLIHGPNSLFGVPGIERDVISSRMTATGLASVLPAVGEVTKYPLYPYLTGRTAPVGDQPAEECGEAPVAGQLKTCLQTAQFGIYQFKTRELKINEVGALVNAGETTDLRFVNDPLAMQLGTIFPEVDNSVSALQLGREVLARFVDVGADFQDLLSKQIYVGTGLDNEFAGLELLVVRDHYDAKTGQVCDALRSDVRDFGDVNIATTTGAAEIVATMIDVYRNAQHNAQGMKLNPVRWVWVMRSQMFIELSDRWPCLFSTYRCIPENSNVSINVNTDEQMRMRLDMQQGSYLIIDGQRIEVIQDDFMAGDDLGENVFSSDIYMLPMTIRGGRPVLFWEYFDYSRGTVQAIRDGRLTSDFWTDRGLYLWHKKPPLNWCTQWQAKVEPRIRLETPQVAARIMNVAVGLDTHWRDPDPTSTYYLDGGNADGYAVDTLYSTWNPPA